ncbi:MAG: magnesium transporter [Clostridia bacterium]|nr:magnesium transporter [Clostridia bacterium]
MDTMNEDFRIDILENLEEFLHNNDDEKIREFIENVHPADIAEVLVDLEDDDQNRLFTLLPWDMATDVLEDINSETFSRLVRALPIEQKIVVLDMMSSDDMVDKLGELSELRQQEIMAFLNDEDADDVKALLVYDEDTAGGIMTKDYISVFQDTTCYEAIEILREEAPEAETIYYVFVTDHIERLVGVISLRELIVSKPGQPIEEIMNPNVISVNVNDDQEEVARVVSKYDLLAIPVVDDENTLIGIITVDDVIDVIEEEATEDILKFVGSSELEDYDDEGLGTKIITSVRSRLPWLIITVFGGMLSATVISGFQDALSTNATLALFMPLLAGMGGNVGTQSSTLTVRNIATGNIETGDVMKTLIHEIFVGMLVGLACSLLVAAIVFFMQDGNYLMCLIVGVAMWANMVTAATIGTLVPLTFKRIGIDPAVASAPFITTTIDITGLSIYFTLATLMITTLGN